MASIDDRRFRRDRNGRLVPTARNGHGLRWRVRYKDPAGRERGKSFARKADAEKFRDTTAADLARGTWLDPAKGRILLGDYARDWLAGRSGEPSTIAGLRVRVERHIIPGLGDIPLKDLRPSRIQAFIAGLPLAPGTVRGVLTTLSAILAAALDDELIASNPARKASVRAPRAQRRKVTPWTGRQVAAIRAGLPERWRVSCDLGAGLGTRQGEAFGLAVDDIDFLRHVVHVTRQVRIVGGRLVFAPPKGSKERDVPLADHVGQAIAAHLQRFPAGDVTLPWLTPAGKPRTARLVMTTPRGYALFRSTFNYDCRLALRQAGITPSREAGTHQLRHRFASLLIAGGIDVRALAEHMGHANPSVTLGTYSHLMPNAADKARKAMEAAFASEHEPIAPNDTTAVSLES